MAITIDDVYRVQETLQKAISQYQALKAIDYETVVDSLTISIDEDPKLGFIICCSNSEAAVLVTDLDDKLQILKAAIAIAEHPLA